MAKDFKQLDCYLGDGVYASFDGYQIILDLRGQDDTTRIALEPSVFTALVKYKERLDNIIADLIAKPDPPPVVTGQGEYKQQWPKKVENLDERA